MAREEATAQAFDQLASAGKDEDLEAQFAQLGNKGVDAELLALKAERQKNQTAADHAQGIGRRLSDRR